MESAVADSLIVEELDIYRRRLHLVDHLSFKLKPGNVLGISGQSGAGKTTLLRVIAGITKDFQGEVRRPRGRVAYVFQEPRLLPWCSARENVELVLSEENKKKQASQWLERVGLKDAMDVYPSHMSGGMKQRVAIARAMATRPTLLLVDEPFSALDTDLTQNLQDDLLNIISQEKPVTLWVSHDSHELNKVSTYRLELDGPPGGWSYRQ